MDPVTDSPQEDKGINFIAVGKSGELINVHLGPDFVDNIIQIERILSDLEHKMDAKALVNSSYGRDLLKFAALGPVLGYNVVEIHPMTLSDNEGRSEFGYVHWWKEKDFSERLVGGNPTEWHAFRYNSERKILGTKLHVHSFMELPEGPELDPLLAAYREVAFAVKPGDMHALVDHAPKALVYVSTRIGEKLDTVLRNFNTLDRMAAPNSTYYDRELKTQFAQALRERGLPVAQVRKLGL